MAAQGSNLFLKLEGVTGESQESGHKGEIEVSSYEETVFNPAIGVTGLGGGLGRTEVYDFKLACKLERAIPALIARAVDHKVSLEAKLSATKVGGSGKSYDYLQITMKNVRVSKVVLGGSMNAEALVSVWLNFERIMIEYWVENAQGGQGPSSSIEFDNKGNTVS